MTFKICLAAGILAWTPVCAIGAAATRPDIIVITADDLGVQLGCLGDPIKATPALDRLAASGTLFPNAYVTASSCSPSRASLFTGLYPHQNGQVGLSHRGFTMNAEIATLPTLLRSAGYATAVFGKVHVEPSASFTWDRQEAGMETGRVNGWEDGTRDVRRVQQSVRTFLDAHAGPVFIKVSLLDPHDPLLPEVRGLPLRPYRAGEVPLPSWLRERRSDPARTSELRQQVADIYSSIARLDSGIDLILQTLREAGRERNALIVFLGDNGLALPGGKTTSYEAGIRVPLIVKWPEVSKPGQIRHELVSAIDLFPTILEAAAVPLPELNRQGESRSLVPLLRGEKTPWRLQLFTEMNFHSEGMFRPMRTVREGPWKLILNLSLPERPEWRELYNLEADPDERRNLAGRPEHQAVETRLAARLEEWRVRTHDPLLEPVTLREWATVPGAPERAVGPYTPRKPARPETH